MEFWPLSNLLFLFLVEFWPYYLKYREWFDWLILLMQLLVSLQNRLPVIKSTSMRCAERTIIFFHLKNDTSPSSSTIFFHYFDFIFYYYLYFNRSIVKITKVIIWRSILVHGKDFFLGENLRDKWKLNCVCRSSLSFCSCCFFFVSFCFKSRMK